jgi:hypothetical protein
VGKTRNKTREMERKWKMRNKRIEKKMWQTEGKGLTIKRSNVQTDNKYRDTNKQRNKETKKDREGEKIKKTRN